eukprot:15328399-Ditylum_brightwellii.AAC.1
MNRAGQQFGYSYRDATPKAWADTFLVTQYQWAFTQHLKHSLQGLQPQKLKVTNKKFCADPRYFPGLGSIVPQEISRSGP